MVAGFLDNAQPIRLAFIGGLSYNLESLNSMFLVKLVVPLRRG